MLNGEIRSAFAMTEPGVPSSDAKNIGTQAVLDGDEWVINGEKYYISGAGYPRCKIMITMVKTSPDAPAHLQQSQILVPMDTPGVKILGPMHVFGHDHAPPPVPFATRAVPGADHEQPGSLPLGARGGLGRDGGEPGDLGQRALERLGAVRQLLLHECGARARGRRLQVAHGGAQARYGVAPDLTVLGKIIGGGMPVGAYGGRRDLMEQVAPLGGVYQAGTLSGNPMAMAAGMATLAAAWGYLGQGEPIDAWGAHAVLAEPAALLHWLQLA